MVKDLENTTDVAAWTDYMKQGNLTSFGQKYTDNYTGRIKELWLQFFSNISEKSKLLDIATGNGAVLEIAYKAHNQLTNVEYTGIDYAQINSANNAINFMSGVNAEELPFEDNSFSHISSQYGIEYTRLELTLKEVSRVLIQGGKFQFICHHEGTVILEDNLKILQCTKEILDQNGPLQALSDLLNQLNHKAKFGYMDHNLAEKYRHLLNAKLGELLAKYQDTFHDSLLPSLVRETLKPNISADERQFLISSYREGQQYALLRLDSLKRAALSERRVVSFLTLAKQYGITNLHVESVNEENTGFIGTLISGQLG